MEDDNEVMAQATTSASGVTEGPVVSPVIVGTEDAQVITDTVLSLPSNAVKDLISVGVCVRCIFRLFGVRGRAYCVRLVSSSIIVSLLKETNRSCNSSVDGEFKPNGDSNSLHFPQESEIEPMFCCVCLGILQFAYSEEKFFLVKKDCVNDFAFSIAELVKKEGYQIDSFSLEVSVPPIILTNERAIWAYMKKKYGSELWFQKRFLIDQISVKDVLKSSITNSLETLLAVKSGVSTFRIRLTYTCTKASLDLQNDLERDHKRRKRGTEDSNGSVLPDTEYPGHSNNETDAVIHRSFGDLQDPVFCENFTSPPEKVNQPCHLELLGHRMPIYIAGRYLKYSRNVSQARWIIDDERMGEASVEEIIGSNILPICRGDNYKFHAAGREDIDVRMLGSGRPFLVEVQNPRSIPSDFSTKEMEEKINNTEGKLVRVRNLKVVGSEGWTLMREGEAEKQKQYAALVWISRPLKDEDLQTISSLQNMHILQKTPIRVLHRRSPLEREKIINWMKVEKIAGSTQYFLLHLCTQAGTYIKEFVHGDLGRTHPNVGSLLGCRAEILQLDVTDVKMDCFLKD